MLEKIPLEMQKEIDRYFNLNIGGKKVITPYYRNSKMNTATLKVMAGKGSPDEIELETTIWAKVKGFDLNAATAEDIRKFMLKMKLGIECSGFVANVIDRYLHKTHKKGLIRFLKFTDQRLIAKLRRLLRPIENINANTLTSDLNCERITNLNDIKPGDFIRCKAKQSNSHHIGLITDVEKEEGVIKRFGYVNSNAEYEAENGVRYGEVFITDPEGELKDQKWTDELNGRNYFYEGLLKQYEDNGIRRLKNLELKTIGT
jgi:hypothetical protein